MYDNKPWFRSTGVLGALIVIIGVVFAFMGMHPSNEDMAYLSKEVAIILQAVGGVMALIGRLKATQGIGKPMPTIELAACAGTVKSPFEDKLSELVDLLKMSFGATEAPARSRTFGAMLSPTEAYPDPAPASPPPAPDAAVPAAPGVPPEGQLVGPGAAPPLPPSPDPQPQTPQGGAQ